MKLKIDRNNCEAWFLDYYEGVLDSARTEELFAFLKVNPDLQELFDSYEEVSFSVDKQIHFDEKDNLKKPVNFEEGINENNYEEYFVAAIENVLSEEEKNQLEKFLVQFPAKRDELDFLRNAILQPENEIVFENKSALKKSILVTDENFEEYAIAAIEGILSAEDLIQFNAFVASNVSAKKEFELFVKTKLQADSEIVFDGKESLKKTPLVVNAENFDELAISSLEGLLNTNEQNAFSAVVANDDKLKKSVALYSQTILSPDTSIVFEDKESLKKRENERGAFWRTTTIRFAAAASIALLIGILWNYSGNNSVDHSKENSLADKTAGKNSSGVNSGSSNNSGTTVLANNDSANNNSVNNLSPKSIPAKNNFVASHPGNKNAAAVVPHVNEENKFFAVSSKKISLPAASSDEQVNFSGAYYNTMNFDNSNPIASNDISLKQAAMRWMKNKLDRSALRNNKDEENAAYAAYQKNKNENVTGFDLTSSAVNALGQATGAHLHLAQEREGTVLTIGKYNVWLNRK